MEIGRIFRLPFTVRFQLPALLVSFVLSIFFEFSIHSVSAALTSDGALALNEMDSEQWAAVEKIGTQFQVKAQQFYVNGFNTYWLMVFAADQSTRGKVSEVFWQASAAGLNVCRTWAFNDAGWRALQISPSVYDEEVFKGLDFVVSEARRNDIRLILSMCNNWEDYGGKSQYVRWGNEAGLNLTSEDEFFMDPTIKGYYKAHVERVLSRINTFTGVMYKDDPTIFAWELINEPRCPLDPSGDTLQCSIAACNYSCTICMLVGIIHKIEQLIHSFFWRGLSGRRWIDFVGWDKCTGLL